MIASYALTFALGAGVGGFCVVLVVAFCVMAAEAGSKAAEECERSMCTDVDENGEA